MSLNKKTKNLLVIFLLVLIVFAAVLLIRNNFFLKNSESISPVKDVNVLLITIDALRADRFSFDGNPIGLTPNIDKLIDAGVVFKKPYCISGSTPPSFGGIFTSKLPYWPPEEKGKWNNDTVYGLTRFFGKEKIRPGIPPSLDTLPVIFKRSGYTTVGISTNPYLSKDFGFDRGFDFFEAPLTFNPPYPAVEKVTGKVKMYLSELRNDKFFLWYHLMDLHFPLQKYADFRDEAKSKSVHTTSRLLSKWTETARKYTNHFGAQHMPGWVKNDINLVKARDEYCLAYDAILLRIDKQIGLIMDTLKEYGLWENTLIIVLNDHGDEFMEHGDMTHTGQLYEELVRGIWVMHNPKLFPTPGIVDDLVSHLDVLPTLVELLKLKEDKSKFDGDSLVPLLKNKGNKKSKIVFGLLNQRAYVRDDEYKFIIINDSWHKILQPAIRQSLAPRELFNLKNDPLEQHNLIEQFPEIADRLYLKMRFAYMRKGIKFWATSEKKDKVSKETIERLKSLGYVDQ